MNAASQPLSLVYADLERARLPRRNQELEGLVAFPRESRRSRSPGSRSGCPRPGSARCTRTASRRCPGPAGSSGKLYSTAPEVLLLGRDRHRRAFGDVDLVGIGHERVFRELRAREEGAPFEAETVGRVPLPLSSTPFCSAFPPLKLPSSHQAPVSLSLVLASRSWMSSHSMRNSEALSSSRLSNHVALDAQLVVARGSPARTRAARCPVRPRAADSRRRAGNPRCKARRPSRPE